MKSVVILGAGRIGALIGRLLADSGDYRPCYVDQAAAAPFPDLPLVRLDAADPGTLRSYLHDHPADALVSALPFGVATAAMRVAADLGLRYFDVVEDRAHAQAARTLGIRGAGSLMPQCGLAPGMVDILANGLIAGFDRVEHARLRVGALPLASDNPLRYVLTWSTEGLINEYVNPCRILCDGRLQTVPALEGLETLVLEGIEYEAFHTSGGLGTLAETHAGRVMQLDYKTLRYPGHRDRMHFLLRDLRLAEQRDVLRRILERVIPHSGQDRVVIFIAVTGHRHGRLEERVYYRTIDPLRHAGQHWSAVQSATAHGLCTALDLVLQQPDRFRGVLRQEDLALDQVLRNRFGSLFATGELSDEHAAEARPGARTEVA